MGSTGQFGQVRVRIPGVTVRHADGVIVRRSSSGVGRLVRRLEQERRAFMDPDEVEVPTARAWRAGIVEGLRLA